MLGYGEDYISELIWNVKCIFMDSGVNMLFRCRDYRSILWNYCIVKLVARISSTSVGKTVKGTGIRAWQLPPSRDICYCSSLNKRKFLHCSRTNAGNECMCCSSTNDE